MDEEAGWDLGQHLSVLLLVAGHALPEARRSEAILVEHAAGRPRVAGAVQVLREVGGAAGHGQRQVLPEGVLEVRHHLVHLPPHLGGLGLQRLSSVDHVVIVEALALVLVETGEQVFCEVPEAQL